MARTIAFLGLLFFTSTANAHFVWIIPVPGKNEVRVVMSDTTEPDSPALLDKIAHTDMLVRLPDGKVQKLSCAKGEDSFIATIPGEGTRTVGGVCKYGVMQRGNTDPFLLMYHAKTELGGNKTGVTQKASPWPLLALEIIPSNETSGAFQVLWNGQPLADAEVVIAGDDSAPRKTDAKGLFNASTEKPGTYGFRVRHIEPKSGEHAGKAYKEVRHYSTYVVHVPEKKK
jgi:uncharacterized GH25 family protein